MKKSRVLALTLVVAVVLMGAGYAYWSETLTINNTVKTGELDLQFDYPTYDGDYDDKYPYSDDYMKVDSYFEDEKHKLVFELEDVYPGGGGWLNFKIKNTGTVPAKLTSITPSILSDEANMKDEFNYALHSIKLYYPIKIGQWEWTYVIPVDFPMYATTFNDFVGKLQSKLSQYTLEPGAYFVINAESGGYDIQLPSTVTSDDFEDETFKFDLLLNFDQAH